VHPIVVTLDSLSFIAPTIWQLAGTKLMPPGVAIPWVVSLAELEIITDIAARPEQLVHFLRRRARLNQLGGRIASDELDWWMYYLRRNLYFEDDQPETLTQFPSLTDPIDAYYLYLRGRRKRPAPKPTQELSHDLRLLLEFLEHERPPGHLAAACTLLDFSLLGRKRLLRDLDRLRRRARRRDAVERGTYVANARDATTLVTIVAVPQSRTSRLSLLLQSHTREHLEMHKPDRALGMGVVVGSSRVLDAMLVVEPGVWELPEPT
jgi:hypothetical protein